MAVHGPAPTSLSLSLCQQHEHSLASRKCVQWRYSIYILIQERKCCCYVGGQKVILYTSMYTQKDNIFHSIWLLDWTCFIYIKYIPPQQKRGGGEEGGEKKMIWMVSTIPGGLVSNANTWSGKGWQYVQLVFCYNASEQVNEMSFCTFKKTGKVWSVRIHVFIPEKLYHSSAHTKNSLSLHNRYLASIISRSNTSFQIVSQHSGGEKTNKQKR